MSSSGEGIESENDTEIWALVNAAGMAQKTEVQRIRVLTALTRLNGRIGGEEEGKFKKAAEHFRMRVKKITEFRIEWEPTTINHRSGHLIVDRRAGIEVPSLPETREADMRTFANAHHEYELPTLLRLMDEVLGFAERHKILDPSLKRNQTSFKQMLGRYSSGASDFWSSNDDVEVIND